MKYGLRRPRVRRLAYCQLLPDDRAPHSTVRASPWRNSEGRESAGKHHRPDRKCMAMAAPGSDRCALHHLEAFTQQRALNRRRRLCGCGAQPDPGYRTCARCRVWAWWAKRRQRNPALRLDYRTTRFGAGCADHGNAARAAREAKLGTGLGARRVGYCLLQKPHVRAAIADLKAAILNRAHQRAEDEERAAALAREAELDRLARLELTALLEIEEAERELKMLMSLGGPRDYWKGMT